LVSFPPAANSTPPLRYKVGPCFARRLNLTRCDQLQTRVMTDEENPKSEETGKASLTIDPKEQMRRDIRKRHRNYLIGFLVMVFFILLISFLAFRQPRITWRKFLLEDEKDENGNNVYTVYMQYKNTNWWVWSPRREGWGCCRTQSIETLCPRSALYSCLQVPDPLWQDEDSTHLVRCRGQRAVRNDGG